MLIIVVLVSLSVVSAKDNQTTDNLDKQIDDKKVVLKNDLPEGTFEDLQRNVNSSSGTLELDRNYSYNDGFSTNGISIDNTIVIDGKGHSIDGKGKSKIFLLNAKWGSSLTFKNIIFKNGYGSQGAALGGWGQAHLFIDNCSFINCKATSMGGAISFSPSSYHNVTIINSIFRYNTATRGAAIWYNGGRNCLLENNTFEYNKASNEGVINWNDGNPIKMINCSCNHNSADVGGVLLASGNSGYCTYIINSKFYNNTASSGGVFHTALNYFLILNSSFISNKATNFAGAIYASNTYVSTINSSYFYNNTSPSGGAIVLFRNVIVSNNTFIDNSADKGSSVYLFGGYSDTGSNVVINDTYIKSKGNEFAIYNLNSTISNCILDIDYMDVTDSSNVNFISNTINANNDYALINKATISLKNNKFNKAIYNKGIISSRIIISVLNNKTITIGQDHYELTATVVDDNNNKVFSDTFNFIENTDTLKAQHNLNSYYYNYENIQRGYHTFSAADSGLTNLTVKTGTLYYTDLPSNYTITINEIKNFTYGSKLSLSVVLSHAISGNITVLLSNGLQKTVAVTDLTTNVEFDEILTPGIYSVEATLTSSEYASKSDSTTFEIYKSNDISLNIDSNTAILGEEFIVSLSKNTSGNVTITINNTSFKGTINGNKAKIIINGISSGTHQVNIKYSGNDIYNETELTTNLLILKNNSFTVLSNLLNSDFTLDKDYEYDSNTDSALYINSKITIEGNNYKLIGGAVYIENEVVINQVIFENSPVQINANATISKSKFNKYINIGPLLHVKLINNTEIGSKNYSISNHGYLFLENNVFNSVIINHAEIVSHVNVTILNNQSYVLEDNYIEIVSSIVDDKGNLIVDHNLNYLVGTNSVLSSYNSTNNFANCTDLSRGTYKISIDQSTLANATVKTAIVTLNIYDLYFDASASVDGDGSKNSPYKYLNSRLQDGKTAFFAKGTYSLSKNSLNDVSIFGEDALNTIIKRNGGIRVYNTVVIDNVTFAGITFYSGIINATNSIFENGTGVQDSRNKFGGVFYNLNRLNINNCTFSHNYAEYGGVIYSDEIGSIYTIVNSTFKNNTALRFGGVIACDGLILVNINDTKIIYDDSTYDAGGAIYLKNAFLNSYNLTISNCKATFGPAVTSLSSMLLLVNFTAENNQAKYQGGAIYAMYSSILIDNSTFANNSASSGGALFIDESNVLIINNTKFISNTARLQAGAIYSLLNSDSTFENITYIGNKAFNNNDLYETSEVNIIIGNGNYTMHHYSNQTVVVIPSRYNLVDDGFVTPIKDQQDGGNCWAFAAIAALESCLLKASGTTYDLSEGNMKNLIALFSDYGWSIIEPNEGGNDEMSTDYLVSWLGPINESSEGSDDINHLSAVLNSVVHVQNVLYLKRNSFTDNDAIKEAILKYGAVGTSLYMIGNNQCYKGDANPNHAVTIVGWDDNYSRNNFYSKPEGDGAWIVKNSWGANWGNNGYFYVSYYDEKFAEVGKYASFTFILNDTLKFDKNYQYDIGGKTDYLFHRANTIWYKNIFTAGDDEYLAAVSTYFEKDTDWEISINVNGVTKLTKVGSSKVGYYTINLDDIVKLSKNDEFEVVFKITVRGDAGIPISEEMSLDKLTYRQGISYFSFNGETWTDLFDYSSTYPGHNYESQVACIKAFTYLNKVNTQTTLTLSNFTINSIKVTANVLNEFGYAVNTGNITLNINSDKYVLNVNNGVAELVYNFTSKGNYVFNVNFDAIGYNNSFAQTTFDIGDINANLVIKNITYGDDLIANITFVDEFGRLLNATVTLNISDKSYLIDVNNGSAIFKIPDTFNSDKYDAKLYYTCNYLSVNKNIQFSIDKIKSDVIINNIINGTYGETDPNISFDVLNRSSVRIVVTKNGIVYLNKTVDDDYFICKDLAAGIYTITIYNLEDRNTVPSNASSLFNISKAISKITINSIVNGTYNTSDVVVSLDLVNCYDLSYVVSRNGVNILNSDFSGNKISFSDLGAGVYNLTVLNRGNENFTDSNASCLFEVNKAVSTIIINGIVNGTYNTSDVVVSLDLVNCYDLSYVVSRNGVNILNSDFSGNKISFSDLGAGVYNLTVLNRGNENFTDSNASCLFEVNKAESRINVIEIVNGTYNTSNGLINLEFINCNDLSYSIVKNGVVIRSGSISQEDIDLSNLAAGIYNFNISNKESENFTGSNSSVLFEVYKANSDVKISSATNVTYNTNAVQVSFEITNKTNAIYNLEKNSITIKSGEVTSNVLNFDNLDVGIYKLTITNSQTENFTQSSDSILFEVYKANSFIEILNIENGTYSTNNPSINFKVYNKTNVCVIVTKKGQTIYDKQVDDEYITFDNLAADEYEFIIINDKTENYNSFNVSGVFSVKKLDITTNIVCNVNRSKATVNIDLSKPLNVNIFINVSGKVYQNITNNGVAILTLNNLSYGNYEISTFIEDENYTSVGHSNFDIDVVKTIINANDFTAYYLGNNTYSVVLTNENGIPVANKTISFIINNHKYNSTTDSNGIAQIKVNLVNGEYGIDIEFAGDLKFVESSAHAVITVKSTIEISSHSVYALNSLYQFKLLDSNGNPLANGKVIVTVDSLSYELFSDDKGVVSFNINLSPGSHKISIFNLNGESVSQNIEVVNRITENSDLSMFYLDGSNYKVRVFDDYGNPAVAGLVVKFIINNKVYEQKTDSNGYAYLNIDLPPNNYVVSVEYAGVSVNNNIVVKHVIKAKKITKIKKSANLAKIKIKLQGISPLNKQKLKIKLNGKKYKVKTNKKGVAYLKFNKKVLNKFKKGKKYSYIISYKSDKLKRYIKVK